MSYNKELDKDLLYLCYKDIKSRQYQHDVYLEYLHMSQFFQSLFISRNGYIIDTGDFRTANYELVKRLYHKIEKHPILFKLLWKYFMVG